MIFNFSLILANASKVTKAARILDVPILVTEQNPSKLGKTCSELDITSASYFTDKTLFSMCTSGLIAHLNSMPLKNTVILLGIETHVCVLQTCLDLLDRKINVIVLADSVSSMNRGEIKIALERMRQAGAVITTSDSIIFQLVNDANSPKFKEISALIKEYNVSTGRVFEEHVAKF